MQPRRGGFSLVELMVVVAIVIVPLIVLFVRRHKSAAIPYITIAVGAIVALMVLGADKFDYMLSGDTSTFNYRQEVLWPQARTIYEQRPWFGIG